jgi:hypothetical protein
MAITTAADFKVYNDQFQAGYIERVAQALTVMVQRGNGAIIVDDANIPGDYIKRAFWKLPSLASRRVTTGTASTAAATAVSVQQGEAVEVRLSRKFGPAQVTLDALRKVGITPETFSMWLGQTIAEQRVQKMLNDALLAAKAAANKTATLHDQSALTTKTMKRSVLAAGMKKLGDSREDIVAWAMHSKPYGDLVDEANVATAGAESIITGVALYGAAPPSLGRPIFVTDSSAIYSDETTDKYFTLGLTQGAILLRVDGQLTAPLVEQVGGLENITLRIQAEADWFLGIKGYAWDTQNGGANPDDTALGTSTNWDLASTSYKHTSGVLIKST